MANAKSGINLVQTAEGALTEVHDMLNRMVKLADQSANGTYDDEVDRNNLQKEVDALKTEIDRIADASNFNGIKLLNGNLAGGFKLTAVNAAIGPDVGISAIDMSSMTAKFNLAGTAASDHSKMTIEYNKDTTTFTLKYTADDKTPEVVENVKLDGVPTAGTEKTVSFSNGLKLTVNSKLTENINATPLEGSKNAKGGLTLQIGDTSDDFNKLTVSIQSMKTTALGIDTVKVSNQAVASTAVDAIKAAINTVSSVRGDLGATQNRLEHTINNLSVMTENIQDAESTIRDVDVAEEMMAYTKNNILVQSAQAMLAQANQVPQGVLQLLQ